MLTRREFLVSSAASVASLALARLPFGQVPEPFQGRAVFDRLVIKAKRERWKELPIGEMVGQVGIDLLGTPYVAFTLEQFSKETCSVNFLGLDCVTFYETCLAFARMIRNGGSKPADLVKQVEILRYRGGKMGDYGTRLHYTTEWFQDNHKRKTVRDITKFLPGAMKIDKPINFMSTHVDSYRQLKEDPRLVERRREAEAALTASERYHVPKDVLPQVDSLLETGDIVAITTSVDGLDTAHTGLCYRDQEGALRFLHASQTQKKVVLDELLHKYLLKEKSHTGVMIAKPL